MGSTHLITGAFGFTGRYITERLLAKGDAVRTLTRSGNRSHPFGSRVQVFPLDFARRDVLREAMDGVDVFYNTYWVRFNKAGFSHPYVIRVRLARRCSRFLPEKLRECLRDRPPWSVPAGALQTGPDRLRSWPCSH